MNRTLSRLSMTIAALLATIPCAFAETRTISWDPVTSYTDGTPFESGKTVSYTLYWTTDPVLGSLRTIGTSIVSSSRSFDPVALGMTRGGTVYFTAKTVMGTGETSALSPAVAWVVPQAAPPAVTPPIPVVPPEVAPTPVAPPTAVLSGVTVSGPSSVNEGGTGTYTASATWDNGATAAIGPTWSVSSPYAGIGSGGLLKASAVTTDQVVTVSASYTSGGVTKTAMKSVTIADVASVAPAAPKSVGIGGPTSSAVADTWRLEWEPVTTNRDGTPLDPGRTVSYAAYWTDDPALASGSLRTLASSISGTTFEFAPSAHQMTKNAVVHLAVRAILDTGDPSSLSPSLVWRVENVGPVPPVQGKIYRARLRQ